MAARLIYAVGPSGAGKDSLLEWLKQHAPQPNALYFARRCITRATQRTGEQHESVDLKHFERLRGENAFALHWQANGLHYGVRHEELSALEEQRFVLVNGSREYLPTALAMFPDLLLLHITAGEETLRTRLQARGRETSEAIAKRIERAAAFMLPSSIPSIEIRNDGALAASGESLREALRLHLEI